MRPDPLIGKTVGPYRVQERIGCGGFANVYLAVHLGLKTRVALKVFHAHLAEEPQFVRRFSIEAQTAARLRHPNIVRVFDTGEHQGVPYIAMDFVDGESLASLLSKRKRLDPAAAVSIALQIASALDYAHAQGVIHRDVKPSNILLDRESRAYLSDFGIAKTMQSTRLTRSGTSIGTPEYMSPEQASGHPVDHRTDVYSLGVVLYEMICGQPPFQGDTAASVILKVVTEVPPAQPLRSCLPPQAADAILRALNKNPAQRFGSAVEMVRAVQSGLGQRVPVPKPRHGKTPPAAKGPQHPWPTLIGGIIGGLSFVLAAALLVGRGCQTSPSGQPTTVVPAGSGPVTLAPTSTTAPNGAAPTAPPAATKPSPTPSPSATPTPGTATATPSGTPALPGKLTAQAPCGMQPFVLGQTISFRWSEAANCYPTSCWYEIEVEGGPTTEVKQGTSWPWTPTVAKQYRWHVRAKTAHGLGEWSDWCAFTVVPPTPTPTPTPQPGTARITAGNASRVVLLRTLQGHEGWVGSVVFSPDGAFLASASADLTVRLWQTGTWTPYREMEGHTGAVESVAFSPDGRLVASGALDHTVRVWQVSDGAIRCILQVGENAWARVLAFDPTGRYLAGDSAEVARMWDMSTCSLSRVVAGDPGTCVAFSPDGLLLASGSQYRGEVRLVRMADGALIGTLAGHTDSVWALAFSPDGRTLASGAGAELRLWNVADGALLRTLRGHEGSIGTVAFSPDGTVLASGARDNTVRLWRVADGAMLSILKGHTREVNSLSFSPNGSLLASGSGDGTVALWGVK